MSSTLLEASRVYSIVGGFYDVYNYYGYGFSEGVYAGALELELRDRGHDVVREIAVDVCYKGRHVAWHRLDMVVDERIIVELKAGERVPRVAEWQLRNYLRATRFEVGVLLFFGPIPDVRRFIDFPKSRR
jgi:GxxExxY protein